MSLLAWLHHLLGYSNTKQLLDDFKGVGEGFTPDGQSIIYYRMLDRAERFHGIDKEELQYYDSNIARHLKKINTHQPETITLRYFQYLAALYTEIYLHRYFHSTAKLLSDLNDFRLQHSAEQYGKQYEAYQIADLRKLALWMATGSGKTLLLHLNYHQFMHYNNRYGQPLDNILLITPNEGLSRQHLAEMQWSGVPAVGFDMARSDIPETGLVQVTEITKLVEEKRGGGVRVPVEIFEGNNLIFVDEGHKGAGGDAWRTMRRALGKTGFTFEYSATFGQALAAANDNDLFAEYGKAIAFDYSYQHFHNDGYGKDFHIINLKKNSTVQENEEKEIDTNMLLLANMLSFYEQLLVFDEHEQELRSYHLERPLWTFIGGSVNAVRCEGKRPHSDILTVANFLHWVLSKPARVKTAIENLMKGKSGIEYEDGRDIFANKLPHLRGKKQTVPALYKDMLRRVMHAGSSGGLELHTLRGNAAELGLRAFGSDHYFGVIYIGDPPKFRKLVDSHGDGITVEDDAFSNSLFNRINDTDDNRQPIQVLIGARKFIEGWNSWRVSSMGLLNIGRSEGSLIIQLFGRGVRLKGWNRSLKRSKFLDSHPTSDPPKGIQLLETLNIFAVRADYMAQFREYLADEGVDHGEAIQMTLPIRPNLDFLNHDLVIPRIPDDREFACEKEVLLDHADKVGPVSVTKAAMVQEHVSAPSGVTVNTANLGGSTPIPEENLDLVDWDAAHAALLVYKEEKGYDNMAMQPDRLRGIIAAGESAYRLTTHQSVIAPGNFNGRAHLQDAVESILRGYTDAFYRHRQKQWESDTLIYKRLDEHDPNFRFNAKDGEGCYIIRLPDNKFLIDEIKQLIKNCNTLYLKDQAGLPRIHFDQHLYQPLLIKGTRRYEAIKISPSGLEESERKFVHDLKEFWIRYKAKFKGSELFLLRNLSRGGGVGFFSTSGVYPDFILWIKNGTRQRIVFIEPHGMHNAPAYMHDEKAKLHKRLKEMEPGIATRTGRRDVSLDSYIISSTPYEKLRTHYGDGKWSREQFAEKHILFPESNGDHLKAIFQFPLPPAERKK